MKPPSFESAKCRGIGPVFVGEDRGHAASGHDASNQFLDTIPSGLGMGASMFLLEKGSLLALRWPHRATTAQFGLAHPVHEMRGSDEQVQVEGPVLTVFEGSESVEHQGLVGGCLGAKLFMEEQAVAAEALRLMLKRAVGDAELAADLAKTRSPDEPVEERLEKLGVSQPVGGGEGL